MDELEIEWEFDQGAEKNLHRLRALKPNTRRRQNETHIKNLGCMKNQEEIILNEQETDFIRYFCESYKRNFEKGKIEMAHHDATAIVLFFCDIFKKTDAQRAGMNKDESV